MLYLLFGCGCSARSTAVYVSNFFFFYVYLGTIIFSNVQTLNSWSCSAPHSNTSKHECQNTVTRIVQSRTDAHSACGGLAPHRSVLQSMPPHPVKLALGSCVSRIHRCSSTRQARLLCCRCTPRWLRTIGIGACSWSPVMKSCSWSPVHEGLFMKHSSWSTVQEVLFMKPWSWIPSDICSQLHEERAVATTLHDINVMTKKCG